jgi:hypothetical protein
MVTVGMLDFGVDIYSYDYDADCYYYNDLDLDDEDEMTKRNYYVEGGNYHETLDAATKQASQYAAKHLGEYQIFKAIKNVSPTTPNVVITDVTLTA